MNSSIIRRKQQLTQSLTQRNNTIAYIPLLTNRFSETTKDDFQNKALNTHPFKQFKIRQAKFRTQQSRTDIGNYIKLMKSKIFSQNIQIKSTNNEQYTKLNIKKRYRHLLSDEPQTERKVMRSKVVLSDGIKLMIDKIINTYEFVKQTQISLERLARLVRIAVNDNKLLCKIFLNATQYDMKNSEMNKYQVVFSKKVILSRFEKIFNLFKKTPEQIQRLLNLFFQKLDNLVHEMDNNIIKDVQKSLLKYNDLIQNMNYEMPIAINKEKYKSQKNILLQIRTNQKNLGECNNISRVSRNRYELLDSIINGIKSHPSW